MNTGEFTADFIASNIEKIMSLAAKALESVDESVQIQLKTAYKDYLNKTREKYSRSKSFFIRNESVDLYSYYVPTGISCGRKVIDNPDFTACHAESKKIIITGSGGTGKSVLLRHLFLSCMSEKTFVPIMIELRDLNSSGSSLDEIIAEKLDSFGFDISGNYIKKAKQAGHFCFFLDGYD